MVDIARKLGSSDALDAAGTKASVVMNARVIRSLGIMNTKGTKRRFRRDTVRVRWTGNVAAGEIEL